MTRSPENPRWLTSEPSPTDILLVPENAMGPFLPVSEDDIDVFNDILSEEIDSAFTSSICCCDLCYDDFKAHWPDVAFREERFQTESMDVFWLVEYSRLPGIYSPAEIATLSHFVKCNRCSNYVPYNIWLYEHLFSDVEEIEDSIDELLTLGSQTPFLLLEHPFAQQVLEMISEAAKASAVLPIKNSLFRARTVSDVSSCKQLPSDLSTYGPPPAPFAGEGRFNHAGSPMLYLASAGMVAAAEIGKPGEPCHVGKLKLTAPLKVLDLVEIDEDAKGFSILRALASSALLAAPSTGEGWLKRQYIFSRFVADCARSAGYDAIRYGSTKSAEGANYVLLVPPGKIADIATLESHEILIGAEAEHRY